MFIWSFWFWVIKHHLQMLLNFCNKTLSIFATMHTCQCTLKLKLQGCLKQQTDMWLMTSWPPRDKLDFLSEVKYHLSPETAHSFIHCDFELVFYFYVRTQKGNGLLFLLTWLNLKMFLWMGGNFMIFTILVISFPFLC